MNPKFKYPIKLLSVSTLISISMGLFLYPLIKSVFIPTKKTELIIDIQNTEDQDLQVFYDIGFSYYLPHSATLPLKGSQEYTSLHFPILADSILNGIRIDLGYKPSIYRIRSMTLKCGNATKIWNAEDIIQQFSPQNDIESFSNVENELVIVTKGEDPFFHSIENLNPIFQELVNQKINLWEPIFITLLFVLAVFIILITSIQGKYFENYPLHNWVFITGFILCLYIPYYILLSGLSDSNTKNEFRKKAVKPEFKWNEWDEFPSQYTSFFNDNLGYREEMIKAFCFYRYHIFKNSPVPEKVLIGKNGWLFSSEDHAIDDIRNNNLFTDDELDRIFKNLLRRIKFLNEHKIKFYLLIAPNKFNIYREHVPKRYPKIQPQSRWNQLYDFLNQKMSNYPHLNFSIIHLNDTMLIEKKQQDLYYKTDLHWNQNGAFIAASHLTKAIHQDFPQVPLLHKNQYSITVQRMKNGDMARMINIQGIKDQEYLYTPTSELNYVFSPAPFYPTYNSSEQAILTLNPDTSLPRVVIFRDSFTNDMIPFLSPRFERGLYLWTHDFDEEIIKQEKPDIVIHEIAEKLIHKLLIE